MSQNMNLATGDVFVFDAYGTLFDVHSAVARHRDRIGPEADRLSDMWRTKQLEYTWVRTLCGAYRDFADLTAQSLEYAAARCGGIDAATRKSLLEAYETLAAYPDVMPTLSSLRERGARLAILSNGTSKMLASALASADLGKLFECVLSVDDPKRFKTAAEAYALVENRMQTKPTDVMFLSSNRWDIAGAVRFGFRATWVNRSGLPDEYADLRPERVIGSLAELVAAG